MIVDHFRKQAKDVSLELEEPGESGDGNLNQTVNGWLVLMVEALPEIYREPLRLFELERLSLQAIADRLGISLTATKSRLQRGREQLRKQLTDCCAIERDRRGNVIDYRARHDDCAEC